MTQRAVAVQLPSWRAMHAVRWFKRAVPAAIVLVMTALVLQPPVQSATAVPAKADPALFAMAGSHPTETFSVIVRETQPGSTAAEDLVRSLGGNVTHELQIVGGFSATVPGSAVSSLTSASSVWRVWGDGRIHMTGVNMGQYDSVATNTVWKSVVRLANAQNQATGAGVGVALLDTGVVPVPDLVNRITHVVDFTSENDGMDRYGHGTHMAGIIAGQGSTNVNYMGVAPGANLISIKVAGGTGATDVSMVMAGLQWAVTHRAQYNIKVLNLSFGTDSKQRYSIDPLDYAVEQAWKSGIFVVAAAGNAGAGAGTITKPGDDPYVLTVGAADLKNTTSTTDDVVADFSSRGPTQDNVAKPDIVAPGVTIVSVRDPLSTIDVLHPAAVVDSSYFKGTGTSQAAAVVSGVAALMYSANPNLTPDIAKAELVGTAAPAPLASQAGGGAGLLDAFQAVSAAKSSKYFSSPANLGLVPSTGTGSLDASRGTMRVYSDVLHNGSPVQVTGEIDVLGNAWSGNAWSGNAWSGNAWSGNAWSAYAWEGNAWSGNAWSGVAWSGNAWSGVAWSGNAWSGNAWSGNAWSGNAWSGNAWSGNAWSSNAWSGCAWSGNAWSGNAWSGNAWSSNAWSSNAWSGDGWS